MALSISVVETVSTSDYLVASATPYPLAQFEVDAMTLLRRLAQKHLDSMALTASAALTAAIDPTVLITPEMEAEYLALATSLWDNLDNLSEGFGLDTLPWEMYAPLIVQAIETSRDNYIDILKALIHKQAEEGTVYGEYFLVPDYIPGTGLRPPAAYLVQFGDIRDALSVLGGGSADPTAQLTTGITGGSVYGQVLQDNGLATNDKLWLYGETVRRTFNGHLQMDGLVFSDWEDPALDVAPQDRWLRTLKYRPGDHWGCACVVVPYVPNFGDPFTMTIQASATEEFYTPGQPRDHEGQWASHRGRITSLSAESIERVHGKGIKSMFPHGGLTTTTPWPSAPRLKGKPAYDSDLVQRELAKPAVLEKVDPRLLYATQPGLAREHVDYYLSGAYEHDGKTSADRSNSANAFPVVYVRNDGRMLILAGHHRAAAALLEGRDLEARMIHEP